MDVGRHVGCGVLFGLADRGAEEYYGRRGYVQPGNRF